MWNKFRGKRLSRKLTLETIGSPTFCVGCMAWNSPTPKLQIVPWTETRHRKDKNKIELEHFGFHFTSVRPKYSAGIVRILQRGFVLYAPTLTCFFASCIRLREFLEQWDWKCKRINEPYFRKKWEMRSWSLEEWNYDECNSCVFTGYTKPWGRYIS